MAITKLLSFDCEAEVLGMVRRVQVDGERETLTISGITLEDAHKVLRALALGKLVAVEVPEAEATKKREPLVIDPEGLLGKPYEKGFTVDADGAIHKDPPKPQPAPTAPPAAAPPSPASTNSAAASAVPSRSEPAGMPGFIDWSGTWCGAVVDGRTCGKRQYEATSGSTCENGHGGADPLGAPAPGGQAFTPPLAAPTPAPRPTPKTESSDDLFGPPPASAGKPAQATTPAQREVGDMPAWGGGSQGWEPGVVAAKNLKEVLSALVKAGHKTEAALLSETERLKVAGHPVLKVIADLPKRVKTACSAFAEQFGIAEG